MDKEEKVRIFHRGPISAQAGEIRFLLPGRADKAAGGGVEHQCSAQSTCLACSRPGLIPGTPDGPKLARSKGVISEYRGRQA